MFYDDEPAKTLKECQERLNYYYEKMSSLDEEDREDYQALDYIKERVSFWKKELLKAEEKEFFTRMDEFFNIKNNHLITPKEQ